MDMNSVFLAAFWTGLAAPAALYPTKLSYLPPINNLSTPAPFAIIGGLISQEMAAYETGNQDELAGRSEEQLTFQF
jgi:hypothetical protein